MELLHFEESLRKRLNDNPLPTDNLWLQLEKQLRIQKKHNQRRILLRAVAVFFVLIGIGGIVFFPDNTTSIVLENPEFQNKPEEKITKKVEPITPKRTRQTNASGGVPQRATANKTLTRLAQTATPLPVLKGVQWAQVFPKPTHPKHSLKKMQLQQETASLLKQAQEQIAFGQNEEALRLKKMTFKLLEEAETELRREATLKNKVLDVLKSGLKIVTHDN